MSASLGSLPCPRRLLNSTWTGQDSRKSKWQPSPGRSLLNKLKWEGKEVLPLVVEYLGVITPDVEALRDNLQLAGMKVVQFAFDGMIDIRT